MARQDTTASTSATKRRGSIRDWIRLLRPTQWSKSAFVLIGPAYGYADKGGPLADVAIPATIAAIAFALASSCVYIVNDLVDAEQDRMHPRKRNRPIASGAVQPRPASVLAACLLTASGLLLLLLGPTERLWVGLTLVLYVGNVGLYSVALRRVLIADVMCLALGFVLRVIGGCASVGIWPSTWLLNVTLFLAMFLAFGKRLGERRSLGEAAASARAVQRAYTTNLLEMAVVVTGVATLLTYTSYVQAQALYFEGQFNVLWLTVLPATYALFRCIVLLDRGEYDDPTELATHDRLFQSGAILFLALTVFVIWQFRLPAGG
jgi:decaprenyl-phosphate phosphoribosyltransferase